MSPAEKVLPLVPKLRQTKPMHWIGCCTGHDGKHQNMTIRELDDGTLLLKCWSQGCSAAEIVAGMGLRLSDLFPEKHDGQHARKGERRPFPASDVLKAVAFEAKLVALAACSLARGEPLSDADRDRLLTAATRLNSAVSGCGL